MVLKDFTNQEVAKLLRSVAAALNIKKASIFQVRAYETAADGIEHATSEIRDLWEEGRLDDVPGVGKNIQQYLDELFKEGHSAHFEAILKGFDPFLFDLLDVSGIGPKTAQELVELGVKDFDDLKKKLKNGELFKKGFSEKIGQKILESLGKHQNKSNRMLLPYAGAQAERILEYLKKSPDVIEADPLGSLRRRVATVGDLDFAASSNDPKKVVDYFIKMSGVKQILDHGENKANIILNSGVEVDLLVGKPESYGALLQHFTGSKHHNIKLRSLALKKNFSLSEYGVRKVKTKKSNVKIADQNSKVGDFIPCKTEEELYELLDMQTPPAEIREDTGEIEAAIAHKLPKLVELKDIKGDLHLHSNFPMEHPSHGPGVNSLTEIVEKAISLGYEYVGISDHPPGHGSVSEEKMVKILFERTKQIEHIKSSFKNKIRVLNGLEIDILPNGTLSVPNQVLESLDYSIAGIHSSHRMNKEDMTNRLLKALDNPHLDILAHPTGRIIGKRDSFEADWEKVFKLAAEKKKVLEINAFPDRLDLRDDLQRMALEFGIKFVIDTDAHEISQMDLMEYGVYLARRGWVTKEDVINCWDWKKFANWFIIKP